ncbi:MAG: pyroglutamyl-peptidase I [Mixta calida]|uniref:Pyrrolidone-carboxylate peptidase n=4 Tax=Mixta TaxID=2100764 RepID=A0ABM6RYX0_9GAMM|nr:pyroglutamyl-peptidase I [Mixta calida]AIX74433.1 pyrrolidone-carboxylate peptidase [Pantoea sp. PSNIH2]MBS6058240.1 pyroglutamyl-peptidase I [Pantoea sp.]POU51008.1 pyroglutamyl-peptidase I [Pantoea sp. PSNIH5]POU68843.1 pyroglutamyl-peptidase I [Pantoea sp. PSNIH4]POY68844.1 pyroglutamyl-peptidase I [Pantoea sp. PSNIH3]HCW47360.1 pyroglutamyl-peptidase I [Erwiniaceae bacterium]
MRTVLITAFAPFGGEQINPSWEAVRQLHERMVCGCKVVAKELPCAFGDALTALYAEMEALQPELVIAVGQAGGRADITVERVGINIDDARIADNNGNQPIDEPIVPDGPAAYFSTLPIKAIVAGIREAGIPASVSQTAGTFVCNHVMYGLLHRLAQQGNNVRGGFIHIPYLPEQAVNHPGAPSMAAQTVILALEMAVTIALRTEQDLRQAGGATH